MSMCHTYWIDYQHKDTERHALFFNSKRLNHFVASKDALIAKLQKENENEILKQEVLSK